jgi:hypothetical protein
MKLVIVESPYSNEVERNIRYVRACMADCIRRGEAPFASHALYTQPGVLDDTVQMERDLGMEAGFAWRSAAEATIVYVDRGWSDGMRRGIAHAKELKQPVYIRVLGGDW